MSDADTPGLERPSLDEWLERETALRPPYRFELIAGGRSNLTYTVTDAEGTRAVLRRPPTGEILPSAHDMGREHRLISALHGSPVPVARPLGFTDDPAVTGAPFYVMEMVEGHVLRTPEDAIAELSEPARARTGPALVEVLARLHTIEPDDVGLGELGRREAYIERQLRRWHGQWEQSKTRELPVVDEVHARLAAGVPPQQRSGIVHGDYRLDNVMVDDGGEVVAVFDWEICTLGDPLADLGVLLTYWGHEGDTFLALPDTPTTAPGFADRSELARAYGQVSGLDLSDLPFYVAFGNWKLACILEGVYARYRAGVMGDDEHDTEGYAERVGQLAERAAQVLEEG